MDKYYSVRMFVEQFPSDIDNKILLLIADKICEILKCQYNNLGYVLLHPDYNYKDIGVMIENNLIGKNKFLTLNIKNHFFGKCEIPAAPYITFELSPKDSYSLSDFSIVIRYPIFKKSPLIIAIDVKESLLQTPIDTKIYLDIVSLFNLNGYKICYAYLHYYPGEMRRLLLDGGKASFCTYNDLQLMDKVVKHRDNYKNKIIDVFLINTISKHSISYLSMKKIIGVVGEKNVIEENSLITFSLPQTLSKYLKNRFIPTNHKSKVKKILKEEKVID